jgi:hypothetical protein
MNLMEWAPKVGQGCPGVSAVQSNSAIAQEFATGANVSWATSTGETQPSTSHDVGTPGVTGQFVCADADNDTDKQHAKMLM